MAKFDYDGMRATAARLLDRFGKAGAVRRTDQVPNPAEPWNPTPVDTDYPCNLAVFDYTLRERDTTLIGMTDKRVLISTEGLAITPTNGDRVVVDGTAHEIVRIEPLQPADTTVMYAAQVVF